jgi:xylulokinase
MSSKMYNVEAVIGLDVGTSSVKGLLIDTKGSLLAECEACYALRSPNPGWFEQDPVEWWQSALTVLRRLADFITDNKVRVLSIGLTGQMNGAVVLDAHSNIVRPCIIWADGRTVEECNEISQRVETNLLIAVTGKPAVTGYTAPKVLWIRNHEPDQFARIRHLLLPKDYITFRLCGELLTDASDASNTLLFNITNRVWSTQILDALEIDQSILPVVRSSLDIAGWVGGEVAQITGLPEGLPIITGAGDSIAEIIGNSVVGTGPILSVVGSAGNISASCREPVIDSLGRIHTGCHAVMDRWIVTGVQQTAGLSIRWLLENLNLYEDLRKANKEQDPYDLLIEQACALPAGADGLIFLPYLAGERTPHINPLAQGVFFGITLNHHRGHFVRAVLEGIAFAQCDALQLLRELHLPTDYLVVSGGLARNISWHQIIADISNLEVNYVESRKGAAFGAALLAAVGIGIFPNIDVACKECITLSLTAQPQNSVRTVYEQTYALYKELYVQIHPLFRK